MTQAVMMLSSSILTPMIPRLEAEVWRVVTREDATAADEAAVRLVFYAGSVKGEPAFLETLPNVGLIACVSAGFDGVDVPWCRAHGIEVTHGRRRNADAVADQGLGLFLAAWCGIVA